HRTKIFIKENTALAVAAPPTPPAIVPLRLDRQERFCEDLRHAVAPPHRPHARRRRGAVCSGLPARPRPRRPAWALGPRARPDPRTRPHRAGAPRILGAVLLPGPRAETHGLRAGHLPQ